MKKTGLFLLIVFLIQLGFTGSISARETKRLFILASYDRQHVCGEPQEQGLMKGLRDKGWVEHVNLEVERYYMMTKKINVTPAQMKKQGDIALRKIDFFNPQLVAIIDDNAFREVALKLADHPTISVVFSGMNGQPETYNQKKRFMNNRKHPGHNITGVYEKLYVVQSIKVMERAVASLKGHKVVGITDYSPTGNAITQQLKIELKDRLDQIDWELKRVRNWNEYKNLIQNLNQNKDVKMIYPMALSLKVSKTKTYAAGEIFAWTIEHNTKPEMALNYFFSKIGLFGGAAVNFRAMGVMAGHKAGMILSGTRAGKIPIEDAPDYAIVFNLKRSRQLKIDIPLPLLTAADYIYD